MQALTEAGRLAEAEAVALPGYQRATRRGPPLGRDWFLLGLGKAALLTGRPRTAHRWLAEAAVLSASHGFDGPHRLELSYLAVALAWLGDVDAARATVDEIHRLVPSPVLPAEQELGEAWTIAAAGDLQRRTRTAAGRRRRRRQRRPPQLRGVVATRDRAPRRRRVRGRPARRVGRRVRRGPRARLRRPRRAIVAREPEQLETSSQEFEALGLVLVAAEAATEAADAYRRRQTQRPASAALARAQTLAARCEGAHTPGLASAATVVPLTDREREVGTLAASGLSSKDIADRLFLSVRTVENHLQNVYSKLGVAGRGELADALRAAPAVR